MYAYGEGVSTDIVRAWQWLTLAADQGDADARTMLIEVEQKITPQQLAAAKLGVELKRK